MDKRKNILYIYIYVYIFGGYKVPMSNFLVKYCFQILCTTSNVFEEGEVNVNN